MINVKESFQCLVKALLLYLKASIYNC